MRENRGRHGWALATSSFLRWLAVVVILAGRAAAFQSAQASEKEVVSCDFAEKPVQAWKTIGGKWQWSDGCFKQLDPKPADPTKAILPAGNEAELSGGVVVAAKMRLDAWKDGQWARAGVSVCSNPANGHGLNLVFNRGRLAFVHDFVAWGPGIEFPYRPGVWYWIKLWKKGSQ